MELDGQSQTQNCCYARCKTVKRSLLPAWRAHTPLPRTCSCTNKLHESHARRKTLQMLGARSSTTATRFELAMGPYKTIGFRQTPSATCIVTCSRVSVR